ncbi:MAG: HAD family hydrolase [Neptuniibacter sp.]
MQLEQFNSWVFDLDGTLTEPVHDFKHIRSELGIEPEADILSVIEGAPEIERRTMMARLDELELHYAALAQPAEGAVELLAHLSRKKCKLGILTRNSKELALLSLQSIGAAEFFLPENVLGRDEAKPKPSPDGIITLLNQWNRGFMTAVMVGDFEFDLISGKSAGVATIHVDRSDRHWPEVTDIRISSLKEITETFE